MGPWLYWDVTSGPREVVKRPFVGSIEKQFTVWLALAGNLNQHCGKEMVEQGKGFFEAHGFWELVKK